MSAIRKITVSVAGLFIGIVGVVVTVPAANSVADCSWDQPACSAGTNSMD
ncbi:hypothetical protein [Actinophytocola xanthii]|nr:hypothetical protein [Actinophytocola xanthii]